MSVVNYFKYVVDNPLMILYTPIVNYFEFWLTIRT